MKIERLTNQKKAILDYLNTAPGHPDAYQIFESVKKKLPQISLATVYRNLTTMVEKGQIRELRIKPDRANYEGLHDKHHHFVCSMCSCVFNVPDNILLNFEKITEDGAIDLVEEYHIMLKGVCANCRRKSNTRTPNRS